MNLIDLVDNLKTIESAQNLIETVLPGVEYDLIDTYLVEKLNVNSEVKFFDAETIPNNIYIEVDGVKYVNLFPLPMLQEMIEEYHKSQGGTDSQIAEKILQYRIKDA